MTNFIITLAKSSSHLPTTVSLPPLRLTAKPKSREKTMRGSMALRLRRLTKSSAVKKLTIICERVAYSPSSSAGIFCQGTRTGGTRRMSTYMMAAAMAPVTTKVPKVTPMILPARLRLPILATAPAMDAKTMGTTMQNIMLMNTVPKGSSTLAPELSSVAGNRAPTTQPATMATSMAESRP